MSHPGNKKNVDNSILCDRMYVLPVLVFVGFMG